MHDTFEFASFSWFTYFGQDIWRSSFEGDIGRVVAPTWERFRIEFLGFSADPVQ